MSVWNGPQVTYDLVLGVGLLCLDGAFTYLIVDRVVARQERKKRRALSGIVEARLLDLVDGLLTDGLPSVTRTLQPRTQVIGNQSIAIQFLDVDWVAVEDALSSDLTPLVSRLIAALERYAEGIGEPINVATVDPDLVMHLVALLAAMRSSMPRLQEWRRRSSDDVLEEVRTAARETFQMATALHVEILRRW